MWQVLRLAAMRISAMKNTQTAVVTTLNGFRLGISVDGILTGSARHVTNESMLCSHHRNRPLL